MYIDIIETQKEEYNAVVNHPLQSFEWGEFRKKTGIKVIRKGKFANEKLTNAFTLTIHKIPYTSYTIGYLPKGDFPADDLLQELLNIGKQEKCVYIQLEPNVINNRHSELARPEQGRRVSESHSREMLNQVQHDKLWPSFHPLFTKYTFIMDLTKSEDELLKAMHSKTRYNIRLAQKKGVWVEEDSSKEGFETYYSLSEQTTSRQHFYAHTKSYHRLLWETLSKSENVNGLSYHLFHAKYKDQEKTHTLTSWVLFVFKDTLYYPYGASSNVFRETMASNLLAWEAIRFGKKLNLKKFDMWGALGPTPDTTDPWYGFHRFKLGYGGALTECIGSYDLIINPLMYKFLRIADKARWMLLQLKK